MHWFVPDCSVLRSLEVSWCGVTSQLIPGWQTRSARFCSVFGHHFRILESLLFSGIEPSVWVRSFPVCTAGLSEAGWRHVGCMILCTCGRVCCNRLWVYMLNRGTYFFKKRWFLTIGWRNKVSFESWLQFCYTCFMLNSNGKLGKFCIKKVTLINNFCNALL